MKNLRINLKTAMMIMAMVLPLFAMANQPSNLSKGTIVLKGGETLVGLVSPLGQFPNNGTLFQAEKGGKQTMVAHDRIERIEYEGAWYVPATIQINNKSVSAYLKEKAGGSANLYKAYYYAPKAMGKNNSMIQKQWSWVVSTAHHGPVALGHNPSSKQLAKVLDHPVVNFEFSTQQLDEASIIRLVEEYNTAVARSGEGPRM
jgi:hypothetical protein